MWGLLPLQKILRCSLSCHKEVSAFKPDILFQVNFKKTPTSKNKPKQQVRKIFPNYIFRSVYIWLGTNPSLLAYRNNAKYVKSYSENNTITVSYSSSVLIMLKKCLPSMSKK